MTQTKHSSQIFQQKWNFIVEVNLPLAWNVQLCTIKLDRFFANVNNCSHLKIWIDFLVKWIEEIKLTLNFLDHLQISCFANQEHFFVAIITLIHVALNKLVSSISSYFNIFTWKSRKCWNFNLNLFSPVSILLCERLFQSS